MVHVVPLVRAVPAPVPRRASPTTVCLRVRSTRSPARSRRLVNLRDGGRLDQVLGRGPRGRPTGCLRVAWAALDPDRNLPVPSGGGGEKAIDLRRQQRRRGRRGRVMRRRGSAGLDNAGVLEEGREGGLEEAGGGEIEAISAEAGGRDASVLAGPPAIGALSRWVHRRRRRPYMPTSRAERSEREIVEILLAFAWVGLFSLSVAFGLRASGLLQVGYKK